MTGTDLLAAFSTNVDPDLYDGGYPNSCLVGQTSRRLFDDFARAQYQYDDVQTLADHFNVPYGVVLDIWHRVAEDDLRDNYEASLIYARERILAWQNSTPVAAG